MPVRLSPAPATEWPLLLPSWTHGPDVCSVAPCTRRQVRAPGGAIVEQLTDTTCRLRLGAWSWVGLAALLGTFDADLELAGPPELLAAADLLAARYRDSHPTG